MFFFNEFVDSKLKYKEEKEHKKGVKAKANPPSKEALPKTKKEYSQRYEELVDILESISDNVLALDSNWKVTYVNRRHANIFGYTQTEMIGKYVWQLLPKIIGTEIERNFREAMQKREYRCYEIEGIYKKGFYEQSIFPSAKGITIYTKDITERKQAEIELKQKTVAIEQAQNAIFIIDPAFRLLLWNKGAENLYGYNTQEVLGKSTEFLQTHYIGQTEKEVIEQIVKQGCWDGEGIQKRKDGSEIYVLISVTQICSGIDVLGYTAVMRDVTRSKQIEEELKRSRQRIRDILESISDDIFALNRNWNFVYVNRYVANRWGYEPDELIGKNIWRIFPKFTGNIFEENFRLSMQKREIRQFKWGIIYGKGIQEITVFPSTEGITVYGKDITERSKAEKALQQSEELFAKAFHSSPAALFISRLSDGYLIDVNETFLKTLEYDYKEAVGHTALELNIYPNLEERAEIISRFQEQQGLRNFELTIQTKTGKKITVIASIDKISLDRQDHILGTFIDITERKQAEEALKISEKRFRLALKNSPTTVSELDCDLRFKWVYNSLMGQSEQQLVGLKVDEICKSKDIRVLKEFYKEVFNNVTAKRVEIKIAHAGKIAYYDIYAEPLRNKQNEVTGIMSVSTNITELNKAQEAVQQREAHLKMAQRIAHMGSWEFHVKRRKAIWSEELFRIFNLKPQKYGPTIEEYRKFIHPEDLERVTNIIIPFIFEGKLGEITSFDYRVILDDGTVRVLHSQRIIEEVDEHGKPTKIRGIEHDITERKLIEQQLEKYSRDLEQIIKERTKQLRNAEHLATIGQVAGMVGHDIRNPLQAITSELYFARQAVMEASQTENRQDTLESIGIIQEQVDYISKIVSDLQDYSRQLKPEIKEVDLSKLISNTFSTVKIPNKITLSIDIKGFPKLKTDHTFIRRAVTNLANNAIQAMPNGGKLTVTGTQKNNQITITIEDTGKGIPEEVKPKLFTPLFTTKAKGQGFGLAVTKRLIETLGGNITFESQEGKGTKFIIQLPANQ